MEDKKLLHRIQIDPNVMAETDIDACLLFEKSARAEKLRRLLAEAEDDVASGRVRSMRSFLEEFKSDRNI